MPFGAICNPPPMPVERGHASKISASMPARFSRMAVMGPATPAPMMSAL
jgi:hypothetical protein